MKVTRTLFLAGLILGLVALPMAALADSIDPSSYSATLGVGESVTVRKTVTIDDAPPTEGLLDVMFVFDTTGSMGPFIDAAQTAAGDILTGLSGFGGLASGTGYYSEPGPAPPEALVQNLSTNSADTADSINNDIFLGLGGGGGDFPEEGIRAVTEIAEDTSWRTGSARFIIALGDATFKESDGFTLAGAQAALAAEGITFIGIDFNNMTRDDFGGIDPTVLADATGGSIVDSSADPADLVAAILAAVEAAFAEYEKVSVSDLGLGLPGVDVEAVAVGAGAVGDSFVGDYDRSEERTFEFDVTFTGLEEGVYTFPTYALVDDAIVAAERDRIEVGDGVSVPEPGTMLLLGFGLLGLTGLRRRFKM